MRNLCSQPALKSLTVFGRIHVDESNDRSLIMIQRWVAQNLYATEFKKHRSPQVEGDLNGNWTSDRINYVASLKEDALVRAREISADYVWVR